MSLMDEFRMDGRVAVVTGSGQGIGRAIAWGLADAGCDVAINARRQADLDETAKGVSTGAGGRWSTPPTSAITRSSWRTGPWPSSGASTSG